MKKGIILLALIVSTLAVFAEEIGGVVVNTTSKAPISNAIVLLFENNEIAASATTDFNGRFSINMKKGRTYVLEVVKDSYKTEKADITATQEFFDSSPTVTVYLKPMDAIPTFAEMQSGMENRLNEDVMEDIGDLDNLPEGYKIIEAIPLKIQEQERSGFNVNNNQNPTYTNVNVEILKEEFNKESVESAIYSTKDVFPSSYYTEGNIYYGEGKALLTKGVEEMLASVADKLKAEPGTKLQISAFADGLREASIGDYIGKLRAEEVTGYLIEKNVPFEQLLITITGNKALDNGCYKDVECDEFSHQENRRVELLLVK